MNQAHLTAELATLRFEGLRFAHHALDVECTAELIAYRRLVLECAKELWRRKYPTRARLPRGFEEGFRLEMDRVTPGSAAVPIRRAWVEAQDDLFDDEFAEAVGLIDATISAAARDDLLPSALPANVIPLFAEFGRSLRADEVLYVRGHRAPTEAPYTAKARERLVNWVEPSYQDVVSVVGEVRMANVGAGRFTLQLAPDAPLVEGRFDLAQEALVLDALRGHREVRLRVQGLAEFATRDRQMRRFVRLDEIRVEHAEAARFDEAAPAIWEVLSGLGEAAPENAWSTVPADLSTRIEEVVYGHGSTAT
jgi:hypothetical protein